MAIVLIAVAGIFFSGMTKDEDPENPKGSKPGEHGHAPPGGVLPGSHPLEQSQGQNAAQPGIAQATGALPHGQTQGQAQGQVQGQAQGQAQGAAQPVAGPPLTPQLATEFVRWWITKAMDYQQATAIASHKEAEGWMLKDAATEFERLYWGDHIKQGIAAGTIAGSFQPISIVPLATNPDGSVVMTTVGTLVIQQAGTPPASQQLTMDFLIKKGPEGCRVAGFYNKAVSPAATTQ